MDILLYICSTFSEHLFLRTPLDRCFCVFFFAARKRVNLVVIFNKGKEETFAVSLQNRKTCVCIKYLPLARPRMLIAINFIFLNPSIANSQFFQEIKGYCQGTIIFEVIFREEYFEGGGGAIFFRGNYPRGQLCGGKLSGPKYPTEQLPGGQLT